MVLEHALLDVISGLEVEFEEAFSRARDVISKSPGFISLKIVRGIERPSSYLLLVEDPVTGSLNAAAAQWFIQSDRCSAPYSVSQGLAINHKGEVKITQDHDGSIWIGGNTHLTSFAEVEI